MLSQDSLGINRKADDPLEVLIGLLIHKVNNDQEYPVTNVTMFN